MVVSLHKCFLLEKLVFHLATTSVHGSKLCFSHITSSSCIVSIFSLEESTKIKALKFFFYISSKLSLLEAQTSICGTFLILLQWDLFNAEFCFVSEFFGAQNYVNAQTASKSNYASPYFGFCNKFWYEPVTEETI